jgi:hypothetical protein
MRASDGFIVKWNTCQDFRLKFRDDVGISALNLVEDLLLCHNDIRLPNIAVQADSFCLIDFDNSRIDVPSNSCQSKVLRCFAAASKERSMMHTVAQIGMVAFALDTGAKAAEVRAVRDYWLTDHPHPAFPKAVQHSSLAKFDSWVRSKGNLVQKVFPKIPSLVHSTRQTKHYFVRILDAMLTLPRNRSV